MWATCTADWKVGNSSPGGPSPCAGVQGRKGARIKGGSAYLRPLHVSNDHGVCILQQVTLFVPVTIYIVPEILLSVTLSNNQPTNQHSPHVFRFIGFLTKYLLIWQKINYISNGLFCCWPVLNHILSHFLYCNSTIIVILTCSCSCWDFLIILNLTTGSDRCN